MPPSLALVRTHWGWSGTWTDFCAQAVADGFTAVEAGAPDDPVERQTWLQVLRDHGLGLILEVATGDWWIPQPERADQEHLDDISRACEAAITCDAWFISAMLGYDAWSIARSVEVIGRAQEIAAEHGITLSVETHRGRSLCNPWQTQAILEQLPDLPVTADFSHWVVVCERLLVGCEEALARVFQQVHHVHCRLGHEQAPQVADPSARRHEARLGVFTGWWRSCWDSMAARDYQRITMNPEFGTDGYQPFQARRDVPLVDLSLNIRWMAGHVRQQYRDWVENLQHV